MIISSAIICSLLITDAISFSTNRCSGAMLNNETMMTAKHCFPSHVNVKDILVTLQCGEHDRDEITEIILPAKPNKEDIALLKLKTPLEVKDDLFLEVSRYPSMYFEANGKLKKNIDCNISTQNRQVIKLDSSFKIEFRPNRSNLDHIEISKSKNSLNELPFIPGDSGGFFMCKINFNLVYPFEVLGVIKSIQYENVTGIALKNMITPTFKSTIYEFIQDNLK